MTDSRVKETLGGAFHELLDGGDFKVEVEIFIAHIVRGTGGLTQETVLKGLHPMETE